MIYLGADHGGFELKEKIKKWLTDWGYQWEDLGPKILDKDDDYPQFAILVSQKVIAEEKKGKIFPLPWKDRPKGILCCRSAAGMVIAANKVDGIKAATAFDLKSARYTRFHNDANILGLPGDWLTDDQTKEILQTWLTTEFSGEARHLRRLKQIEVFEKILNEKSYD